MTDPRRYDEEEIRAIFELAASDEAAGLPVASGGARDGLTLSELQAIGREVGLLPERIADAAAQLTVRGSGVRARSFMGAPLAVGRTVALDRPLSDEEWSVLVSEIRDTFGARGRLGGQGNLREWSNGRLQVYQEATEDGYRLRLRTEKENGVIADRMGLVLFGLAAVLLFVVVVTGRLDAIAGPLFLALIGAGAMGSNLLLLPGWARERQDQMDRIAARARALTEGERDA